jgi:hypothetical protein
LERFCYGFHGASERLRYGSHGALERLRYGTPGALERLRYGSHGALERLRYGTPGASERLRHGRCAIFTTTRGRIESCELSWTLVSNSCIPIFLLDRLHHKSDYAFEVLLQKK